MRVEWRNGSPFASKLDAKAAHQEVRRLLREHGGTLTPHDVVEAARPKRNPLHDAFEWDDEAAAHSHRVGRARMLLRDIIVRRTDSQEPATTNVVVTRPDGSEQQGYVDTREVHRDADLRAQVVERGLKELRSFRDRYMAFEEFSLIFKAIEEFESSFE